MNQHNRQPRRELLRPQERGELVNRVDRAAAEDEEELLAISAVTLPYDPDTFVVLRGPHKGRDVTEAEISVSRELLGRFQNLGVSVECRTVMLCPWWTWWTFTPARRLTPTRMQDWGRQ